MPCPRCALPDVPAESCPRCGIILAKVREPRVRPRPRPPVADEERRDDQGGHSWLGTLLVLAALGGGLAGWLHLRASTARPRTTAGPSTAVRPAERAPLPEVPPPALDAFVAPPLSLEPEPAGEDGGESMRAAAGLLASRLANPASITDGDITAAENLLAAHPEEKGLRELLEAFLINAAGEDHRKRQYARGVTRLQRASVVQPTSARPWLALLQVHLTTGDWSAAEAAARAAIALDSRNPDAWRSLGYALMRQDRNREAADALRTANEIREDGATQALLARVQKGMADEQGMTERQLSHFHVRYDGETHEAVGREILRALERHYSTLATTLDHQPSQAIPVILFSRESYHTASGAPSWSGGVYDSLDGRIRIPIGGLSSSLSDDMDGTLLHELTHAFVADRTKGVAPRDVHEGLAQYMEGRRIGSDLTGRQLTLLADGRVGGVMGYYLSALSFVEYLIANRGMGGMNELLEAMGRTGSVDEAFRAVHGGSARATQEAWAERLRRQHGS